MNAVITPHALQGTIDAIASKSMAHRLLICAALSDGPTDITCTTSSKDIEATIACLEALGATIERKDDHLLVSPIPTNAPAQAETPLLDCGESGSTLRFMLPVVAALGRDAQLTGHGRLASRPLSPLYEELIAGGCDLSRQGEFPLSVSGKLRPGRFELPGNVSSQYISGLLLAAPLLGAITEVKVQNPIESRPYIDLTISALSSFGIDVVETRITEAPAPVFPPDATGPISAVALSNAQASRDGISYTVFSIIHGTHYRTPGKITVEGDWSNAAFWFAAGALGEGVTVNDINLASRQGDKAILAALAKLGARVSRRGMSATCIASNSQAAVIDASNFPDLVPPLAAVAALSLGHTTIENCARLRLKESDRIETVCAALSALGADIASTEDTIEIDGKEMLEGGCVDAANDHRIAMMAAIAASRCSSPVTIIGAECCEKSYPTFFEDYRALGGIVELSA